MTKQSKAIASEMTTREEDMIALLASSNRWDHLIGSVVNAEVLDEVIEGGDISFAVNFFGWATDGKYGERLATVAVQCREAYLIAMEALPELGELAVVKL